MAVRPTRFGQVMDRPLQEGETFEGRFNQAAQESELIKQDSAFQAQASTDPAYEEYKQNVLRLGGLPASPTEFYLSGISGLQTAGYYWGEMPTAGELRKRKRELKKKKKARNDEERYETVRTKSVKGGLRNAGLTEEEINRFRK